MPRYAWKKINESTDRHGRVIGRGEFELYCDGVPVMSAFAKAADIKGRFICTRTAQLISEKEMADVLLLTYQAENGLVLTEELRIENDVPVALCSLSDVSGEEVETNYLTPLVAMGDKPQKINLWKSLWTRMLCVPYDNDMWLRYEAIPLRAGQKSYDVTVLFTPDTREGVLIGALDFSVWKNALLCSAYDAKTVEAVSGIADEGTHDTLPHGTMAGRSVASSRFTVLYGADWRDLLDTYGDIVNAETKPMTWDESPFGFNSWAGLAWHLAEDNFRNTGRFMQEELRPNGFNHNGLCYTNLDACWQMMGEKAYLSIKDELHGYGQKAGIYDGPFAFFGGDINMPLPGVPGHTYAEILLRDRNGDPLPRVDGSIPLDVTNPLWEEYTRIKFRRFVDWGYDYVKIDFLSHAGMEGVRYDKSVRTGRQALVRGYKFIADILNPAKIGRPFFISLSIAPLFPNGYGHARRFSCDAFGTNEDVEYVLNSQTYSWWVNRKVYAFNDPDHIVLLKSFCMERDSTDGEARARYTSAVIAGGVMMLSDDYERPEAKDRARMLATNREVNAIAAAQTAFRPVECGEAYAAHAFTAKVNGQDCLALFALPEQGETVTVDCARAGIPEGTYRDLWTGEKLVSSDGVLVWRSPCCNAMLLVHEG